MDQSVNPRGIKARRKALGLTCEGVGALTGASKGTVSRWERGEVAPSSDALPALAAALQCSIEDLYAADMGSPRPAPRPSRRPIISVYPRANDPFSFDVAVNGKIIERLRTFELKIDNDILRENGQLPFYRVEQYLGADDS